MLHSLNIYEPDQNAAVTLMPHQVKGVEFLLDNQSALLHHDQGTGKTYIGATAAGEALRRGVCLWIGPAVSRRNAAREIRKIHGDDYKITVLEKGTDSMGDADFIVVSYDLMTRSKIYEQLTDLEIDVLILDELQYLKNYRAKRTQRVLGQGGLAEQARHVWAMSGTPCPNNVSEIYPWVRSQFPSIICEDWLSGLDHRNRTLNYHNFVDYFCATIDTPYGKKIIGNRKAESRQLWTALSPAVDRVRKEDVLKDLPPVRFSQVEVAGDKTQREVRALEEEYREQLEQIIDGARGGSELEMHLTTLRRATEMCKVGDCIEMVRAELEDNAMAKVVIFANFIDSIEALVEGLKGFGARSIHGSVSPTKRQRAIDGFQKIEDYRVLVGQTLAAGTAITLHANGACQDVVFLGADWVPGNNAQAVARVHRKGQTNHVHARFLHLSNSLDEAVQKTLMHKARNLNDMYGERNEHHAA